jgi:hypothetical protein
MQSMQVKTRDELQIISVDGEMTPAKIDLITFRKKITSQRKKHVATFPVNSETQKFQ